MVPLATPCRALHVRRLTLLPALAATWSVHKSLPTPHPSLVYTRPPPPAGLLQRTLTAKSGKTVFAHKIPCRMIQIICGTDHLCRTYRHGDRL